MREMKAIDKAALLTLSSSSWGYSALMLGRELKAERPVMSAALQRLRQRGLVEYFGGWKATGAGRDRAAELLSR